MDCICHYAVLREAGLVDTTVGNVADACFDNSLNYLYHIGQKSNCLINWTFGRIFFSKSIRLYFFSSRLRSLLISQLGWRNCSITSLRINYLSSRFQLQHRLLPQLYCFSCKWVFWRLFRRDTLGSGCITGGMIGIGGCLTSLCQDLFVIISPSFSHFCGINQKFPTLAVYVQKVIEIFYAFFLSWPVGRLFFRFFWCRVCGRGRRNVSLWLLSPFSSRLYLLPCVATSFHGFSFRNVWYSDFLFFQTDSLTSFFQR